MGFFFNTNTTDYDTDSVRETLEHAAKPKLTQKTLFSMEPAGYCGSVYEDPRGLALLRTSAIISLAIGIAVVFFLGNAIYQRYTAAQAVPESVQALSDQSGLAVPQLVGFMGMDDETVYSTLQESYTMYQTDASEDGMSCLDLPAGVDSATVATYYMEGFSNLTLDQIAGLLRTTWFLSTVHDNDGDTLKVKYADFTSGSETLAIKNATKKQYLDSTTSTVISTGTDENDNTYTYGSIVREDGNTYYWRIAACRLNEVYSVDGLPSDAMYVGITVATYPLMTETTTDTSTTTS